jgi:DNA-binding PadR family transcriptional regulator
VFPIVPGKRSDNQQSDLVNGVPLFILMSLMAGEKHGHSLMKDIEHFAGVRLGPGTLYKAIARLESIGLIEALDPEGRRRPYGLTPVGQEVLVQSLSYLDHVVEEGQRRVHTKTLAEQPSGPARIKGTVTA